MIVFLTVEAFTYFVFSEYRVTLMICETIIFVVFYITWEATRKRICPVCKNTMKKKTDEETHEQIHYCDKDKLKIQTGVFEGTNA